VRCLLLKARFISEDGLRAGTGGDFDRPLGSAPMRIGGTAPIGKGRHWNNVARRTLTAFSKRYRAIAPAAKFVLPALSS